MQFCNSAFRQAQGNHHWLCIYGLLKSAPLGHQGYSGISVRMFASGRSSLSSVASCAWLR